MRNAPVSSVFFAALLPLLFLASSSVADMAPAEKSPRGSRPNILIRITTVKEGKEGRKVARSYSLICADGESSSLSSGARVPIPTTTTQDVSGADAKTVTSLSYQNAGLSASLEASILGGGAVLLNARLEDSSFTGPMENSAGARPRDMRSMNQNLRVVLKEGKPLRVASIDNADGESFHLEIEADILD